MLPFLASLETNARVFLKYAGPGAVVAAWGVIVASVLGDIATIIMGSPSFLG